MLGDETTAEDWRGWKPDSLQRKTLERIYDHYRQNRAWPLLSALCYQLRRDGEDPAAVLGPIPQQIAPVSQLGSWNWEAPQGGIALTFEGIDLATAGHADLESLVIALNAIGSLSESQAPTSLADDPVFTVTSDAVEAELHSRGVVIEEKEIATIGALINQSGLTRGGSFGPGFQTWQFTFDLPSFTKYSTVESVSALLDVREEERVRQERGRAEMTRAVVPSSLRLGGFRLGYQAETSAVTIQSNQADVDPHFIFVVMPFGEPWSDQVYGWIRSVVLELRKQWPALTVSRSGEAKSDGPWISAIQRSIRRAGVVICDLTANCANCIYELGLAHGSSRDTIILTQTDAEHAPSDIRAAEIMWPYDLENEPAFRTLLKERLLESLGGLAPDEDGN